MTATLPDVKVEVAFGDHPLAASPTWTDISSYVRAFNTNRGRSDERSRIDTGAASLVLDNRDRRFDPKYASSPYYPNVRPLRRCRISLVWSAVTYIEFDGYIEGWNLSYVMPSDAVVRVPLSDGFKLFERFSFAAYSARVLDDEPVAYWRLDESAGSFIDEGSDQPANARRGSRIGSADGYFPGGDASTFDGSATGAVDYQNTPAVGVGTPTKCQITGDLTVEFFVRPAIAYTGGAQAPLVDARNPFQVFIGHLPTGTANIVVDWGDDAGIALGYRRSSAELSANTWYHVAVVRSGAAHRIYINGTYDTPPNSDGNVATAPAATPYDLQIGSAAVLTPNLFNGRISHVAIYDKALSAEQIASHYAATTDRFAAASSDDMLDALLDVYGWPAGRRAIAAGSASIQAFTPSDEGDTLLESLQKIADAESGMFYISRSGDVTQVARATFETNKTAALTLGDGGGSEVEYAGIGELPFDELEIFNIGRATRRDGVLQEYEDATSRDEYGSRVADKTDLLVATDNDAYDHAAWAVYRYKDPHLRFGDLVLRPQGNTSAYASILPRDLGDRITFKRRPPGGGTISENGFIQRIAMSYVAAAQLLEITWSVFNAESFDVWLLGDTTYGVLDSTTRLGF